ncbi:MAG: SRPBCC family protein [Elusimicrobiota bacterium]
MTNSNGKATTTKKTFSRETSVSVDIHADRKTIWGLLTNAENYPKWNSTVISIDGKIALGEKIQLKSYLDPKKVFKLSVKEFEPERRLVWGDAMGKREYSLTQNTNGQTNFSMTEKIGGPLFPLFAKMIPPFDESFEKFASDLKKEAEKR